MSDKLEFVDSDRQDHKLKFVGHSDQVARAHIIGVALDPMLRFKHSTTVILMMHAIIPAPRAVRRNLFAD